MSETAIFDLYRSLKLGQNPVCRACKAAANNSLEGPVGIWQVGARYHTDPYRLALVGKTARGSVLCDAEEQLARDGFIDGTGEADKWIRERWGAYWSYTAAIIEKLFKSIECGWERIALTNLIKCNNSMDVDRTTPEMCANCLDKLGVTWRELDILRPHNIILFTGRDYDPYVERYTSRFQYCDKTDAEYKIPNGEKMIYWWERHCRDKDGRQFRILRTSHPERQQKDTFVCSLAQWVKSTN